MTESNILEEDVYHDIPDNAVRTAAPANVLIERSRDNNGREYDYAYDDFISVEPYTRTSDESSIHSYIEVIRDDQPVEGKW